LDGDFEAVDSFLADLSSLALEWDFLLRTDPELPFPSNGII
jgi:hypothetical protein